VRGLWAYVNPDGGIGALEPDLRAPAGQPLAVLSALAILAEAGARDDALATGALDWLLADGTNPDGGVPFVLPSLRGWPHVPWLEAPDDPPSSLLATAGLVAHVQRLGLEHQWRTPATEFCWARAASAGDATDPHTLRHVLDFLDTAGDRPRAEALLDALAEKIPSDGVLTVNAGIAGEVLRPLDLAPHPGHAARRPGRRRRLDLRLGRLEPGGDPRMARDRDHRRAPQAARLRTALTRTGHETPTTTRRRRPTVDGVTRGRTELHFHLLPDLDDGPADDAAAVELARAALRDGTTTVVCTPHARFLSGARDLADRVAGLRRALQRAGVALDVRPGAELQASDVARFSAAALDAFSQGPPAARWLLLEAPLDPGGVDALHAAANELLERGFGVLLAHVERSPQTLADARGLAALREQGVLLQVNATSLTGLHGEAAQAAGLDLIRRGAVAVVASDGHGPDRPPSLSAAVGVLREHGIQDPEHLVAAAPRALLRAGLRAPAQRRLAA
jgi:tyrosine-protein phosphatase YwqE